MIYRIRIILFALILSILNIILSYSYLFSQIDRNYNEYLVPFYNLPELLIDFDGKKITSAEGLSINEEGEI